MDARAEYVKREGRKRDLVSLISTVIAYSCIALGLFLLSLVLDDSLEGESGPMRIKLGSSFGSEEVMENTAPEIAEAAASLEVEPPPPADEPPPEKPADKPRLVEASSPKPASSKAPITSSPRPSAPPRSPAPSSAVAASSPKAGTALSPAPSAKPGPAVAVIKGSEAGNSWETRFEAGSGAIGRNFYEEIYLYMPLPFEVSVSVFEAIPARGFSDAQTQKKLFLEYYEYKNGVYSLKTQVPLKDRMDYWLMLEDARYPVKRADYKQGKYLRPVSVRFRVGSTRGGTAPVLLDVELKKSSGYSDIDDAVLYGFRKATFSNDTDRAVWGTFTYVFD